MSATKVYTKNGDKGTTSLVGGTQVLKHNPRIEAYGTLDELNSVLGIVRAQTSELTEHARNRSHIEDVAHLEEDLESIQRCLFLIGSHLACEDDATRSKLPSFDKDSISWLERRMDQMSLSLKPLTNFLIPSGGRVATFLHLARTVCRRAERRTAELHQSEPVAEGLIQYLNRLSDYFFVASRFANQLLKKSETEWRP